MVTSSRLCSASSRCVSSDSRCFGFSSAGVLEQRVERAEASDQLDRALLADTGHAGDVVARVADERQHVDNVGGHDAEFLQDALLIEPRAVLARIVDAHVIADELKEVLVDGHDHDLEAGRGRAPRHRADDVVGFVAGEVRIGTPIASHAW